MWPEARQVQRKIEFIQGNIEREEGWQFFTILETDWTTAGLRSISCDRFAPPKPFLVKSSSDRIFILRIDPITLATSSGFIRWSFTMGKRLVTPWCFDRIFVWSHFLLVCGWKRSATFYFGTLLLSYSATMILAGCSWTRKVGNIGFYCD